MEATAGIATTVKVEDKKRSNIPRRREQESNTQKSNVRTGTSHGQTQDQKRADKEGNNKINNNNNTRPQRRALIRPKSQIRPNDVYVSEKSTLRAQLEKCKKLFSEDYQEIFLHGLGNAIPRTLNIATELKNTHYLNTIDFETTTSTVKLVDDLVPKDDTTPASYSSRNVPTVTIRLFRTVRLP